MNDDTKQKSLIILEGISQVGKTSLYRRNIIGKNIKAAYLHPYQTTIGNMMRELWKSGENREMHAGYSLGIHHGFIPQIEKALSENDLVFLDRSFMSAFVFNVPYLLASLEVGDYDHVRHMFSINTFECLLREYFDRLVNITIGDEKILVRFVFLNAPVVQERYASLWHLNARYLDCVDNIERHDWIPEMHIRFINASLSIEEVDKQFCDYMKSVGITI